MLFDESQKGPFEVPQGFRNKYEIRNSAPGALKLYNFHGGRFLVCSVRFHVHFSLLVIKLLLIILNIQLKPCLKQITGLNLLNM